MIVAEQLRRTAFTAILKAAAKENAPAAFKETVEMLLNLLRVKAPKGVFAPTSGTGKLGRPISTEGERMLSTWIAIGEPSLYKNDLAQAVYGARFTAANGIERRKLRDKCRRAVERNRQVVIKRFEMEIAELQNELDESQKTSASLTARASQLEVRLAELKAVGVPETKTSTD
jgi:hypothetical protein